MQEFSFGQWTLSDHQLFGLVRRLQLTQPLAKRLIEEQIIALVDASDQLVDHQLQLFRNANSLNSDTDLQRFLLSRHWSLQDLELEAVRSEALLRFADNRFGSGLEDIFLRRKPDLDRVIYSLLRVRDSGLARELWIQISEREISFAQAASQFGEGEEARHAGQIGPVALGDLHPIELRQRLRRLQVGAVDEPQRFGEWVVLLRLEQIMPVLLDAPMRHRLLFDELEAWLQERSLALIDGRALDPLDYHPCHERDSHA